MNKAIEFKLKSRIIGVSIFLSFILSLEIFYFFSFIDRGLMMHYGYSIGALTSITHPVILTFLFALISVSLLLICYGFIFKKLWARKFTILFMIWSAIWPIWGLIELNQVILNSVMLIIFVNSIVFLNTKYVIDYFQAVCKFRGFTLYKKEVTLKNGFVSIIHFFAKKIPKSGTPTTLPEGFEIRVCSKTKLPYIRRIGSPIYMHGKYTLYKRIIQLKNGYSMPIYFFSIKKPKSGKPSSLPNEYIVKENKRSHMPYLTKKATHN